MVLQPVFQNEMLCGAQESPAELQLTYSPLEIRVINKYLLFQVIESFGLLMSQQKLTNTLIKKGMTEIKTERLLFWIRWLAMVSLGM